VLEIPDQAPPIAPALKDLSAIAPVARFVDLSVPGFPDAVVSLPVDASAVQPVLVVLHGMDGRPDVQCDVWRTITRARGFIVCPRGVYDPEHSPPDDARYTLPYGDILRRHVAAALEALRTRFGEIVDVERPLLAGFSLGATEAATLALSEPEVFPRIAILEGGVDGWVGTVPGSFAKGGGIRVLFGCGSSWCTPTARAAAARLSTEGVESRVAWADVGHRNAPELIEAIQRELQWFVEGDDRWAAAD
jgi:pimeloyl-ACP methyl ester carboxylesterase